ncbi:zinc metallopeptidase [Traorella massiliensis]|uniref:zinc metallopeptidase n=1 Tax=Traorella massiliensis TaxID=1903263 RepID=UPI0008F802B6|nr:zinc metallopeptidase [Traorella massiliensis]
MDYLIWILIIVVMMISQSFLSGSYQKYRRMQTIHQMRGCDVAKLILERNGVYDVTIVPSKGGTLSDYYDPTRKIVNLSSDIYYNSSIASVSVAAHEVGHALQHAEGYGFIALRNKLLPATQIASQLGWVSIFIGLISNIDFLLMFGIFALILIMLFQLVTLPIEFNASSRAIVQLRSNGIIEDSEVASSKKMLQAAAFTYVAALISTILNILRILLIRGNRNRD